MYLCLIGFFSKTKNWYLIIQTNQIIKLILAITLVPNCTVCSGEILYLGKHVTSKVL